MPMCRKYYIDAEEYARRTFGGRFDVDKDNEV